jgi:hypothetical protein
MINTPPKACTLVSVTKPSSFFDILRSTIDLHLRVDELGKAQAELLGLG